MAKSNVRFLCGCGFTCTNPLEAAVHCDSTGHTLDVMGKIQPDIAVYAVSQNKNLPYLNTSHDNPGIKHFQ